MFRLNDEKLKALGAVVTTREIEKQTTVWQEVYEYYQHKKMEIIAYLDEIASKHEKVRVIFTGAGTSAFVGDTVVPYLKGKVDEKKWELMSVATTDIVSNPSEFLNDELPTLMISFARSGNSPESVSSVYLAQQLVKDFYQLTITCALDGELAKNAQDDDQNLLLLMPAESNDKGFAMTSSFTCMALMSLLVFDTITDVEKGNIVKGIVTMADDVIKRANEIQAMVDQDFERVIYLGSGGLAGLAREATLKILELTAGKIATLFDSSLGFRHGPKSFVDGRSLIFVFTSNDTYTRQYDLDILNELQSDRVAKNVYGLRTFDQDAFWGNEFIYKKTEVDIPDGYLALSYIVFAQIVAVMTALKVENTPDTPSVTGTVNRVVKGVNIHSFEAQARGNA